jgi:NADH:ubiquinone oxidoreductase subunit E
MAWIVENRREAPPGRAEGPYLTDDMKMDLATKYFPRYPTKRAVTLPALHYVQHKYGWIPPQALAEIADFLGQAPAEVLDCASFYEEFWLKPKGKYLIAVCRSLSCELLGSEELRDAVQQQAGHHARPDDRGRALYARRGRVSGRVRHGAVWTVQRRAPRERHAAEFSENARCAAGRSGALQRPNRDLGGQALTGQPRRRRMGTTVIIAAAAVAAVLGTIWWVRYGATYHFVRVDDGLYRDGNRSLRLFANGARRAHYRTVVALVDDREIAQEPFVSEVAILPGAGD